MFLKDQRGSALLTTLMATAAGLLAITVLIDFFSIYVAKRAGQTTADAAALGALEAVEQKFNLVARGELNERVSRLMKEVDEAVQEQLEDWEDDRRSDLRATLEAIEPPLEPDVIEDLIDAAIHEERPGKRKEYRIAEIRKRVQSAVVEDALIDKEPVPLVDGLEEFFTAGDRGCLIKETATKYSEAIRDAAGWFSSRNGGQSSVAVTFPYEAEIKVRVVARTEIPLGIMARFAGQQLLPVEATSRAENPGGLSYDLTAPCQ
jgi:hypothetical protein